MEVDFRDSERRVGAALQSTALGNHLENYRLWCFRPCELAALGRETAVSEWKSAMCRVIPRRWWGTSFRCPRAIGEGYIADVLEST
jgi:hypothetical protein